ncbi:MAG: hypothetical protein MZV65_36565 [Chromatiales bacterium]|nr:hypothetical protein [Chromatiales bacterium]
MLALRVLPARGSASWRPIRRALAADLDDNWEVLAEPIQTVMRRYGVAQSLRAVEGTDRAASGIDRDDAAAVHCRAGASPTPRKQRLLAHDAGDVIPATPLSRRARCEVTQGSGQ